VVVLAVGKTVNWSKLLGHDDALPRCQPVCFYVLCCHFYVCIVVFAFFLRVLMHGKVQSFSLGYITVLGLEMRARRSVRRIVL